LIREDEVEARGGDDLFTAATAGRADLAGSEDAAGPTRGPTPAECSIQMDPSTGRESEGAVQASAGSDENVWTLGGSWRGTLPKDASVGLGNHSLMQ